MSQHVVVSVTRTQCCHDPRQSHVVAVGTGITPANRRGWTLREVQRAIAHGDRFLLQANNGTRIDLHDVLCSGCAVNKTLDVINSRFDLRVDDLPPCWY